MWLRAGTLRSKVFFDFRLVKLNSRKPSKLSSNSLFVCNWQRIGEFNINIQTCECHVMVGRKIDYSRKTYRNGCSLAYIFTHLRSVKMRKNVLVAFRILPTPSRQFQTIPDFLRKMQLFQTNPDRWEPWAYEPPPCFFPTNWENPIWNFRGLLPPT